MQGSDHVFFGDRTPLVPSDAAAAILSAPGTRYVLQLRDARPGIFYPGHWGCFGGALEPSDASIEDGLRRELREETGLDLPRDALAYFTTLTFDFAFAGLGVMKRYYYVAQIDDESLAGLRLGEGSGFAAVPAHRALLELRLVPYDAFGLWLHFSRTRLGSAPSPFEA